MKNIQVHYEIFIFDLSKMFKTMNIPCFLNKAVPMAVLRHQICNIAVKH